MRLTFCLILGFTLQLSAASYAQQVSISAKDARLETVFRQIKEQTGYTFVYRTEWMQNANPVDISLKNASLDEALNLCFKDQPFTYAITRRTIVLKQRQPGTPATPVVVADPIVVKGQVVNADGDPVPGASVLLAGAKNGVVTDANGYFSITAPEEGAKIRVSFIGFEDAEFKANTKGSIKIKLQLKDQKLEQVVVTGMMNRDRKTFSGATAMYTGEQLKTVSNVNVIQGLRTLDPSFLVLENNLQGSNPNTLPTIELRGQTSISTTALRDEFSIDPNQPLFILDGFQASLQQIVDLDINRVASITILKDAASTAIYGSRASNGVVVVETIRPKSGLTSVSYTNDMTFEFPDLTSYNRMDAAEKLEFERLSGRYQNGRFDKAERNHSFYQPLYAFRRAEVERGVNSYWLSDPVRNGVSQRHSLYVGGGNDALTFDIGGNFRKQDGVMKGSGKQDWGTRLNLSYRNKNLRVNNNLYVAGVKSTESPYGSFATWVNMNPYYRKADASVPNLEEFFDQTTGESGFITNPLYNAMLASYDRGRTLSITNNLQANYDIMPGLRAQGSLQVVKNTSEDNTFVSPLDTRYRETSNEEKGQYTMRGGNSFSYTAAGQLTYYKNINKNTFNVNLRAEMQESKNRSEGFTAIGFPAASNGNPRFAYGFKEGSAPSAASSMSRRNSLVSTFAYSYDMRYNVDATFSYDGSTAFGIANPYSPFYSLGGSWNMEKERFMRDLPWVNSLRLRANAGLTGNQNFSATSSVSTYNYTAAFNYFGQGVTLTTLGNPNLKWQNTLQYSAGLDASLFENRVSLQVNAYQKLTDPLVVAITLPSSTGLSDYPFNAGDLTVRGVEFTARVSPVFNPRDRKVWTIGITGSKYSQVYDHFDNRLRGMNEKLRNSNSLTRYRDGYSPDDIWAVPSLGIDPATGRELFRKMDGTTTFDFDYDDQVVVGNTRPMLQGVLTNSVTFKGLFCTLNFRYILNQDIFNNVLYNRVENISMASLIQNNQDKRALYERWKKTGDQSEFKSISITDYTPISSRFVQRENTFTMEAANIGYQFQDAPWLKKARLSNLKVSGYTNEIFRISNIRRERGTEYPYARSFSFSLTANFQ
ncbi:SusC/RagA family TonB-linked outer membrane protein [Chitinophaga horti]|uniref:SusC/RagA family TonB-linked outer membrane protein n=1 Tax=Chitinophaga horti TaxID=2920382 RepID=A0ABY6J367_9BACT|nr:SusC/RagA family TonB-linked outer membrane protein [Chitinophaga horti]UYQ94115.1 SusC/RagA family TonB-linked outer membrane protein [Chitinophaga horti]